MVSVNGNHLTTLIMKTTKLVPHFRGGAARLIDASLLTQDVAPSVGINTPTERSMPAVEPPGAPLRAAERLSDRFGPIDDVLY